MLQFLNTVLPSSGGLYIAAIFTAGKIHPAHVTVESKEALANVMKGADLDPSKSVFFALSSYAQGWHESGKFKEDGTPKMQLRTSSNATYQRAFWIDLDVGEGKKKYATKAEAVAGIKKVVAYLGVAPLVVESKNGYHCYWPLDADVSTAQWQPVANAFKSRLAELGVFADPARTADAASVLRPIGTTHRKSSEWFTIKKIRDAVRPLSLAEFASKVQVVNEPSTPFDTAQLHAELKAAGISTDAVPAIAVKVQRDAEVVVNQCKQLTALRTPVDYWTEPLLFSITSILAKCTGGREMMHKIASQDARYTGPEYVDLKVDTAIHNDHAPALCTTLEDLNPAGCAGCPFKGQGCTPLHLKQAPKPDNSALPDFILAAMVSKAMSKYEFVFSGERAGVWALCSVESEDSMGNKVVKEFKERLLESILIPLYTVKTLDGTVLLYWREYKSDGSTTDRALTAAQLSRPDLLGVWLINNGIPCRREHIVHIADHVHRFWATTTGKQQHLPTYAQFGWVTNEVNGRVVEDGFVLGDTVMWPNKAPMRAVLAEPLQRAASAYTEKGERDIWFDIIKLYESDPSRYAWAQAIICLSFGSIMAPWLGNNDGLPMVYVYGKHSGIGKSAVTALGFSLYGNPKAQQVTPGASATARIGYIATRCNLPTFHDELTTSHREVIEAFLMELSQNKEKTRLTSSGAASQHGEREWSSVAIGTGNVSFAQNIANSSTADLPILARLIQVDTNHMNSTGVVPTEVTTLINKRNTNYGIIGREWIQYILDNFSDVVSRCHEIRAEVATEFGEMQRERIQGNAYALIKIGAEIAKKAGLHNFDWDSTVSQECLRWATGMRAYAGVAATKQSGWFSELIRYLSQEILETAYAGPRKDDSTIHVIKRPAHDKAPKARVLKAERTMYVPSSVIREFVEHTKQSYADVVEAWEEQKLLLSRGELIRLAANVPEYVNKPERCFKFDLSETIDWLNEEIENAESKEG